MRERIESYERNGEKEVRVERGKTMEGEREQRHRGQRIEREEKDRERGTSSILNFKSPESGYRIPCRHTESAAASHECSGLKVHLSSLMLVHSTLFCRKST